ncbi:MAG: cupin domain-containing protein [Rhodothermales bacterium]|nr:cupin domain-containing protein [Rhodothermales bacterium]
MDTATGNKLCISRAENAAFGADQFRDWLTARDLGLAAATDGAYGAQVTRARAPGHATGPHYHEMTFQIVYVLRGWVTFWYEGEGEFTLGEGDFVYHPPTAVHDLRAYSDNVELLEIFAPAHPKTVDV